MARSDPDEAAECEGIVVELLPHALYRVRLDSNEQVVAHLAGSPQRNFVRILAGDRVSVARSSRNRTRGRITRRIGH
jgi:translation initiation factor IF-1